MNICKNCGYQFDSPFCPNCGAPAQPQSQPQPQVNQPQQFTQPMHQPKQKKSGCLAVGLAILGMILLISIVCSVMKNFNKPIEGNTTSSSSTASSGKSDKKDTKPTEKPIKYAKYKVSEMMDDLDNNAMKAEKKYTDKYVEITGKLYNIDSDGKYIDLGPTDDEFAIIGVQCYIKTKDQSNKIMDMKKGQTVTLKGKITEVGEVIGYSLDIKEIK